MRTPLVPFLVLYCQCCLRIVFDVVVLTALQVCYSQIQAISAIWQFVLFVAVPVKPPMHCAGAAAERGKFAPYDIVYEITMALVLAPRAEHGAAARRGASRPQTIASTLLRAAALHQAHGLIWQVAAFRVSCIEGRRAGGLAGARRD